MAKKRERPNVFGDGVSPKALGGATYGSDAAADVFLAQLTPEDHHAIAAATAGKSGNVILGNFEVGQVGLIIQPDTTVDEIKAIVHLAEYMKSAIQWIIGDLIVHSEDYLNMTYDEMAVLFGKDPELLRGYVRVAKTFPYDHRIGRPLTYTHHKELANRELAQKRRLELLQDAAEKGWSTRDLIDEIDGVKQLPAVAQKEYRDAFNRAHRRVRAGQKVSRSDFNQIARWMSMLAENGLLADDDDMDE